MRNSHRTVLVLDIKQNIREENKNAFDNNNNDNKDDRIIT